MHEPSNDLWTGGPWEQPSPSFPTPPAVVIPPTRAPLLRAQAPLEAQKAAALSPF